MEISGGGSIDQLVVQFLLPGHGPILKIIEADEVGSLGVVLHKAQDSTALLGPVSAALRQGQEELGHSCGHGHAFPAQEFKHLLVLILLK